MYKVRHEMAPSSLRNMFQKTNEVHEDQTRQAKQDFLHRSLKQITWKSHLAIEVQWPGIIHQVKLKILKLLILPRLLPSHALPLRKDPGWGWSRDTPNLGWFQLAFLKHSGRSGKGTIADVVKCKNKQKQRHAYQHTFIVTKNIL